MTSRKKRWRNVHLRSFYFCSHISPTDHNLNRIMFACRLSFTFFLFHSRFPHIFFSLFICTLCQAATSYRSTNMLLCNEFSLIVAFFYFFLAIFRNDKKMVKANKSAKNGKKVANLIRKMWENFSICLSCRHFERWILYTYRWDVWEYIFHCNFIAKLLSIVCELMWTLYQIVECGSRTPNNNNNIAEKTLTMVQIINSYGGWCECAYVERNCAATPSVYRHIRITTMYFLTPY